MPSTTPFRELTKDWTLEDRAQIAAMKAKLEKQIEAAALRAKRKKQPKRSPHR